MLGGSRLRFGESDQERRKFRSFGPCTPGRRARLQVVGQEGGLSAPSCGEGLRCSNPAEGGTALWCFGSAPLGWARGISECHRLAGTQEGNSPMQINAHH